ncbi:YqaA family protein [Trichloromonas sp.]|uniref:YqaA family protein n=1 Tax=Trichloromonas sp. TaxID=3069249 RepID=UPI002A4792E3|nr:VTT domain-containing protein [Trichloromonas sp.]
MKIVRRLYDWVLHWVTTPYGTLALFCLAFAESSFFPIPPDVLLIALCIATPRLSFRYALLTAIGSVLGGILGYGIGHGLWEAVSEHFFRYVPGFTEAVFAKVQTLFATYDFWTVFTAGFTPIPYKVITIGAGVFEINFLVFIFASIIGRSLRFFLVAALIYRYGAAVRDFIEKYFNLLTLVFMLLLIGGFLIIKYLF